MCFIGLVMKIAKNEGCARKAVVITSSEPLGNAAVLVHGA